MLLILELLYCFINLPFPEQRFYGSQSSQRISFVEILGSVKPIQNLSLS
jgi:hypothetical protein